MPKYSMIVPIYNSEQYSSKCLNSIKEQSLKDFEVIMVNDGSTDTSEEIARQFVDKDTRFSLFTINQSSRGSSKARNHGVSLVNGKYFIFVDSDDYIEHYLLQTLDQHLENNPDLVSFNLRLVDEEGYEHESYPKPKRPNFSNLNGEQALLKIFENPSMFDTPVSYLYRTDYFREHNYKYAENRFCEDFGLTPLIVINAKKVESVSSILYNYVQTKSSIMRGNDYQKVIKKADDVLYHFDRLYEQVNNEKYGLETRAQLLFILARCVIYQGKTLKEPEYSKYMGKLRKRKIWDYLRE